ncbi:MAG TPA: hypothetical protein VFI45_20615, partial [Candidatus Acidoferrum sp.]|nr:hypothetical protein [Candidatus Acidoferrum sp.]
DIIIRKDRQVTFRKLETGIQRKILSQFRFTCGLQWETTSERGEHLGSRVGAAIVNHNDFPPGSRRQQLAIGFQNCI